jgi:ABC-type bacteriocin/lantibiotic exporter with double-glycine peptidase domain
MNDALKNPILLLIAGLLVLVLVWKVLKIFLNLFWIIPIGFILLFIFSPAFRELVQKVFNRMFR